MSKPVANPKRLSSLPETEDSRGIGPLFRNARELVDEEFPTLRWRVRASQRLRATRPRLFLRAALVVGLAFLLGGVVGAAVRPFWAKRKLAVVSNPVSTTTPTPTSRHGKPRPVTSAPAAPALAGPAPAAPEPVVDEPRPASDEAVPATDEPRRATDEPRSLVAPAKHRAGGRVALLDEPRPAPRPTESPAIAPPSVPFPSASSPIAVEQSLLGQAMKTLRDGRDARTALALLRQHAERFPQGALASEATMLRIEALLALGSRDEALLVLDGVGLASLPNRDEQRVVRGELRAAHGRWREAAQDFDDALGERHLPAPGVRARTIQERALWGRAAARSRLGDQAGARADLDLYLRHFPGGRFAGSVAALLKGVP